MASPRLLPWKPQGGTGRQGQAHPDQGWAAPCLACPHVAGPGHTVQPRILWPGVIAGCSRSAWPRCTKYCMYEVLVVISFRVPILILGLFGPFAPPLAHFFFCLWPLRLNLPWAGPESAPFAAFIVYFAAPWHFSSSTLVLRIQ